MGLIEDELAKLDTSIPHTSIGKFVEVPEPQMSAVIRPPSDADRILQLDELGLLASQTSKMRNSWVQLESELQSVYIATERRRNRLAAEARTIAQRVS